MKITNYKDLLQPDISFSIYFNEGNINNIRYHVRAIVDDYMVVMCYWSKKRQNWRYVIKDMYWMETFYKYVKNVRKEKQ